MRLVRDLVLEPHARGATILFSTHVMPQAEQICEHIVMIHEGAIVLDERQDAIRSRFDPRTIVLEPLEHDADVGAPNAVESVARVVPKPKVLTLSANFGAGCKLRSLRGGWASRFRRLRICSFVPRHARVLHGANPVA